MKIQEAITLFTPSIVTDVKQPESFGEAWLANKNDYVGTAEDIVINNTSPSWKSNIDKLKSCFEPIIINIDRSYNICDPMPIYSVFVDKKSYAQEMEALARKVIQDKATKIISCMNPEKTNKNSANLLYPAPMEAFNEAWDSLYVYDSNKKSYSYNSKNGLKDIKDSKNVKLVKKALLDSFAGMEFGTIKVDKSGAPKEAVAEASGTLPPELAKAMNDYAKANNIILKNMNMPRIFNAIKAANTFPLDGWIVKGVNGLQPPVGAEIPMDKVTKSVKAAGSDASTGEAGGVVLLSEDAYYSKFGRTTPYQEYLALHHGSGAHTTSAAAPGAAGISKDSYNNLLQLVQAEMNKPSKKKPSLTNIKMTFTITQDYKGLKLPSDQDYTDMLFTAFMKNQSYEDFMASPEYQAYLKDNPVSVAAQATAPVSAAKSVAVAAAPVVGQNMEKYTKMLKMLPEGAVRQTMMKDGLTQADIDAFFAPATSVQAPVVVASAVDQKMEKYKKMVDMKLPEGAVRQKMRQDGLPGKEIDAFFGTTAAPVPTAATPKFELPIKPMTIPAAQPDKHAFDKFESLIAQSLGFSHQLSALARKA